MNLNLLKIGYIIAVRYERKKKFNLFGEGIYQKQLWEGFNSDDALFCHVAISSGEEYLVNITPPKAKLIKLTEVYKGSYIKILKYKGENFDNPNRYKIACIYNAIAANLSYDWRGVAAFILPYIKQMPSRFFCSEACCKAYQTFYPNFFSVDASKAMPAYFLNKDDFELVWEGIIKE